jgi:hypothetical protein
MTASPSWRTLNVLVYAEALGPQPKAVPADGEQQLLRGALEALALAIGMPPI